MTANFWTIVSLFGAIAAIPVGYVLVRTFSMVATQPMRLELAELGEQLLLDEGVSEEKKSVVREWLDEAFDGRWIVVLSLVFPLILVAVLGMIVLAKVGHLHLRPQYKEPEAPPDIVWLAIKSQAGMAPFATAWLLCQAGVGWLILRPLSHFSMTLAGLLKQRNHPFWLVSLLYEKPLIH